MQPFSNTRLNPSYDDSTDTTSPPVNVPAVDTQVSYESDQVRASPLHYTIILTDRKIQTDEALDDARTEHASNMRSTAELFPSSPIESNVTRHREEYELAERRELENPARIGLPLESGNDGNQLHGDISASEADIGRAG